MAATRSATSCRTVNSNGKGEVEDRLAREVVVLNQNADTVASWVTLAFKPCQTWSDVETYRD